MLRIRPYKKSDVSFIVDWLTNEDEFIKWSGGKFSYPLSEQTFNEWQEKNDESTDVWSMVAVDEKGTPVGHLCMRDVNYEKESIYFCFIVIDPAQRGKGYGKEMLQLALKYVNEILKLKSVSLSVFTDNIGAIKCYESLGLYKIENPFMREIDGVKWELVKMGYEWKA